MTFQSSRRDFLTRASLAAGAMALPARRLCGEASTQVDAHIQILPDEPIGTIAPEIYGHFIEELGGVVHDGVWVGRQSSIPNDQGVRKAFIDSMRAIHAPVLRWPGGCFADSYDWRDGIGTQRPQRAAFWGQEDSNQYGTHEFMHTCRAIGCEPYLAADLRALPARDFYQWIEYCNAPAGIGNDLANQREKNGDREPFHVKYWGVGNESWLCGGAMSAEEYATLYRRYTTFLPTYNGQSPHLISVGPNGLDLEWTRRVTKAMDGVKPWGLSTHYYVSGGSAHTMDGDALKFTDDEYYLVLSRAQMMESILQQHWAVLREDDPEHRIKFVVDEWGVSSGTGSMIGPKYALSQVPTMRHALVSGITFDAFQRNADKVAMACVAQTINCLHSLMRAREDKFVTTPIYNVFQMYMAHMGSTSLRTEFAAASIQDVLAPSVATNIWKVFGYVPPGPTLPGLTGSASIRGREIHLTVVNPHISTPLLTQISIPGVAVKAAAGYVLQGNDIHAHNTFDTPNAVTTRPAAMMVGMRSGSGMLHTFPPASVTALTLSI